MPNTWTVVSVISSVPSLTVISQQICIALTTVILLQQDTVANICQAADKQLFTLVEWAKRIPHFQDLPIEDQVTLLRSGEFVSVLICSV